VIAPGTPAPDFSLARYDGTRFTNADLEGRTLTDFVLQSAQAAAERTIERRAMLILTARESEAFAGAILNPPAPGLVLRRAARSYRVKTGKPSDPMEMTQGGALAFAFTPGKIATLKVEKPPASFCLLFSVPKDFKTGTIRGVGAAPLPVPALTAKP